MNHLASTTMVALIFFRLNLVTSPFKPKSRLEAENAALRHHERSAAAVGSIGALLSRSRICRRCGREAERAGLGLEHGTALGSANGFNNLAALTCGFGRHLQLFSNGRCFRRSVRGHPVIVRSRRPEEIGAVTGRAGIGAYFLNRCLLF
jgi:hypothetical protein